MKTSLTELADRLLADAQQASAGRAAETVFGGHDHTLRQTVVALAAKREMDEHESPGQATLQVLRGRVRLSAGTDDTEAGAGELIIVPDARHSLLALEDAVILLTVAKLPG
jgi:quercetin dioxygenase-like cupin family protein